VAQERDALLAADGRRGKMMMVMTMMVMMIGMSRTMMKMKIVRTMPA
jgi:hypothetical protein